MLTPLSGHRRTPQPAKAAPVQPAQGAGFTAAVDRARRDVQGPAEQTNPGGVIVRQIRYGDTVIGIGGEHGFTREQMLLMLPRLKDNPNLIQAGDTLEFLEKPLFDTVQKAVATTQEALASRNSAADMQRSLAGPMEPGERKQYQMELPNVQNNASAKESEAKDLLKQGFLEAGLPVALDPSALPAALDAHAAPVKATGRGQPGFAEIVDGARQDTLDELDRIFGPLRDSYARAKQSNDWAPLRDAAIRQMQALTKDSPDRERAVRDIGDILITAGGADAGSPYSAAIRDAADSVLTLPHVQAIQGKENNIDEALKDPDGVPVLTALDAETAKLSPELAVRVVMGKEAAPGERAIPGAGDIADRAVADMLHFTTEQGMSTRTMPGEVKFNRAVDTLAVVTDRLAQAKNGSGEPAVDRMAEILAKPIDEVARKSGDAGMRLAGETGVALRESMKEMRSSPKLAVALAEKLRGMGRTAEADKILDLAGQGVEKIMASAGDTGKSLKTDFLGVAGTGGQNVSPEAHADGVKALSEHHKGLLDKVDRTGELTVLTLDALKDLPEEWRKQPGGGRLFHARDELQDSLKQEDGDISVLLMASPKAAIQLNRIDSDREHALLEKIPDEDLDKLIDRLGQLPPSDPVSEIARRLGTGEPARQALREDAVTTLALFQHVAQTQQPPTEGSPQVPGAPDLGFVSRMGRWAIYEIIGSRKENGRGFAPGLPLEPKPGAVAAAEAAASNQATRQALSEYARGFDPNRTGNWARLADMARGTWQTINPPMEIVARPGLVGPGSHLLTAGLQAWGVMYTDQKYPILDQAWGWWFSASAADQMLHFADSLRKEPSFSAIQGLPRYEWVTRGLTYSFQALSVLYVANELRKGDVAMAAAWVPGTVMSFSGPAAAVGRITGLGGPMAGAAGWLLTAVLVTAISQYRHVQEANRREPMFGAYMKGALPGVEKPESFANCDEDGRPYLALQPEIARRLGIDPAAMTNYVAGLKVDERDRFIDYALQVKPDKDGNYPVERTKRKSSGYNPYAGGGFDAPGIQRSEIESIDDFLAWAKQEGYKLPGR
ncbi:hypothetical protein [Inquilinus sp. Marseille-Q2685]|uniref:hypothetical protein n=1 Tax=Inquilinus sp. Marseille-Q2685 TaxID=2866581 RepID=UPI001CE42545|nr:hypothetical protein [Inquilinus sp. Marseille-Q2685]